MKHRIPTILKTRRQSRLEEIVRLLRMGNLTAADVDRLEVLRALGELNREKAVTNHHGTWTLAV